jgi:hypothetical protein
MLTVEYRMVCDKSSPPLNIHSWEIGKVEWMENEMSYHRLQDDVRDPVESTECGRPGGSRMTATSSCCNEHPVKLNVEACHPGPFRPLR